MIDLSLELGTSESELTSTFLVTGRIESVSGCTMSAELPMAAIGDVCKVYTSAGKAIFSEIIAFNGASVTLAPFESLSGVGPGSLVENLQYSPRITAQNIKPGMIVDAFGRPLSNMYKGDADVEYHVCGGEPLEAEPPNPLSKVGIDSPMFTGIASLDSFCTIGYGQRIGLFASAGLGKSTLLGMIAKNANVDVVVIGLIGERGREVNDFIVHNLSEEGLKKSILVVSTSDSPTQMKVLAAKTATTLAEHYRAKGKNVLLLIDSLTRMARAQRELGISVGELPVQNGYTPSVYAELAKLVERAGRTEVGSITAVYTVLTQVNSEFDPLGDEIKSLLDGHIVLSENSKTQGLRPAIDLPKSISRLFERLHNDDYLKAISFVHRAWARYCGDRELAILSGNSDEEYQKIKSHEAEIVAHISQGQGKSPFANFEELRKFWIGFQKKLAD